MAFDDRGRKTNVVNVMSGNDVKILQAGMPKSGNFWLYRVIQEILKAKDVRRKSFIQKHPIYKKAKDWDLSNDQQAGIDMMDIEDERCYYRISSVVRNPIYYLPDYVRRCTHVWTHSEVCDATSNVFLEFNKIVYVYRDPRDVAVSAAKFAFTPYMKKYYPHNYTSVADYLEKNYERILDDWRWHLTDHLLLKDQFNIHFVAYENLLEDFRGEVSKLAGYLGYELSNHEILNIYKFVNFREMKMKNPDHVNRGKKMQWVRELSNKQKELADAKVGELLEFLNYPHSENEKAVSPQNANKFDPEEVRRMEEEMKYSAVEI